MRSLLVRIFLSFWLIIGITTGVAAVGGYYYAERMREAIENFEIGDALLEASAALDAGGRSGLKHWLEEMSRQDGVSIYIVDANERDLLNRPVPHRIRYILRRHTAHMLRGNGRPGRPKDQRENLRPAQPLSQLVLPDGEVLTLVAVPPRHPYRRWLDERRFPWFLALALMVSATVSYLLARAMTRPVQDLRKATDAIADGALQTRVRPGLHKRRDELGMLARDFDRMAARLQHAAEQQTELSRNISHELRSPLARLRVALELARRQAGELPEFARIDAETDRLDQLIGQILSYTRLDGKAGEPAEPVPLADLLRGVVENVNYESTAETGNGVRVTLAVHATPTVLAHSGPLESAIENVLRNAVRHSPPAGIVSLSLDANAEQATITVTDDGSGVDDSEIDKLFQPFFRTRTALQRGDWPGSGLGLAIAARAVHLHGGAIDAANRDNGGLRVTITLPRKRPH